MSLKYLWLIFFLFLPVCAQEHNDMAKTYKDFIRSFISEYDFSCEGRYTHEYHSYVLEKTKNSFKALEDHLQKSGFSCSGRQVIMGYQKNGVASYYSSCNEVALHDEASLSSKRGRVVPAHNIFGFLTGFLLKDVESLQSYWHKEKPFFIEHTYSDRVELFDDAAYIFQKHAFGKDFDTILNYRKCVEKSIKKGNCSDVLKELIVFWKAAYQGELKSCTQETLATQDILFSIDYAKYLVASSVPVTMMHIGPDITYPIEELNFQKQEVTESAQAFVKKFTASLKPVHEGKKTVYVFCSFVDGVGKSTLLGNVINWVTYGERVDCYKRVDNASSQKGVLYSLCVDVFILDLPAQLSHWISKPDGYVFVDGDSIVEAQPVLNEIKIFIESQAESLKETFKKNLIAYKKEEKKEENFLDIYLSNIHTCGVKDPWIFFTYDKWIGLFDEHNPENIRLLVPFEGVHSKGLKIARSEQMLFTKGLLIPLKFEVFMEDVTRQLKEAGIEDIVFVDFLSMYPRSSRENIRINFLLQQMKKIYGDTFKIEKSLYHTFMYQDIELSHLLDNEKNSFIQSLVLEAVTRASLYVRCTEKMADALVTASFDTITNELIEYNNNFLKENADYVYRLVAEKIESERLKLHYHFFNKKYEVFIKFSCEPLYAFSSFLEQLFGQNIDNTYFQELWNLGPEVSLKTINAISESSRDQITLSPLLTSIRSQWFSLLSNLIECKEQEDHSFFIENPVTHNVPLLFKKGPQETALLVQRQLPQFQDRPSLEDIKKIRFFNNFKEHFVEHDWVEFHGIAHCINWDSVDTYHSVYGYGFDWKQPEDILRLINVLRKQKIKEGFQDAVIFSSELLTALQESGILFTLNHQKNNKKVKVDSPQGKAIALWARSIATLEMIAKDPYSLIVTRKGNALDFAATLQLLENITLPRFFNIELDKPLFSDYTLVQPVISWNKIRE